MSQGRNPTNDGDSGKDNELSRNGAQPPQIELDAVESNGGQTLISFSGGSIDGAIVAVDEGDVCRARAREIAHDVIDILDEDAPLTTGGAA